MNETLKRNLNSLSRFFSVPKNRRLFYIVVISIVALWDFLQSGLVRRTFVFYSSIEQNMVVEDRMLRRSGNREADIRRYVEEALLGSSFPGCDLLFPRGTRLNSFIYSDSAVYADLSESAVLPIEGHWDIYRSLLTLKEGIQRNFPYVGNVWLFIGGNEVFFEEFHGISADLADNMKTSQ